MGLNDSAKYALKAISNFHRQGPLPNVFLFATARGGSTWVMEILASQPGMKFYDEPLNIRRENVARTGLFPDWESLMPDTGDADRIVRYLKGLGDGEYPFMNPPPFRQQHRLRTNRIVFKIHEVEHLMGRIARECNGQILLLLRHPIPTTLSRTVFPRLHLFLASRYYDELIGDGQRLREIHRIGTTGSKLQKGTVSWCYNNLIPLRHADFDALVVTYEELVLNPTRSCDLILDTMRFTDRAAMLAAFGKAAVNIGMSGPDTAKVISEADQRTRNEYLVSRWQSKVTPQDRSDVTEIMELFGIDAYSGDRLLSHSRYLHFPETRELVAEASVAAHS